MSRIHFFIPISLGALLLLPLFAVTLVGVLITAFVHMPWWYLALFAGFFGGGYALYNYCVWRDYGCWHWQIDDDATVSDPSST